MNAEEVARWADRKVRWPGVSFYDPIVILNDHVLAIGEHSRIDSFVKLECGVGLRIGRHVHIASFCHIGVGGGEVELGDYSAFASGAKVISGSNSPLGTSMSASAPPEMQVIKRGKVIIGPYAFLATNAVVLPGVQLGEGAVLAAGGVATKDIPSWEIWGGVPARFLSKREVTK